jgi:hypothetical protein
LASPSGQAITQFGNLSAICSFLAVALLSSPCTAVASTFASVALTAGADESLYNQATGFYDRTSDSTPGELRQEQSDPDNVDVSASIKEYRHGHERGVLRYRGPLAIPVLAEAVGRGRLPLTPRGRAALRQ